MNAGGPAARKSEQDANGSRDPLLWAAPGLILVALLVLGLMAWLGGAGTTPTAPDLDSPIPEDTTPTPAPPASEPDTRTGVD